MDTIDVPQKPSGIDTCDTYHRLDESRIPHLEWLHKAVYGQAPAPGLYRKKYATDYTGLEYIGFIAYAPDGTPAGYYGVIPCYIRDGHRRILAAQSADTMTHPGYRMKGMFVELSRITFALCKETGIRLVFGFPNDNSYHGAVNKLGWQPVGRMFRFMIPVSTIIPARMLRRIPFYKQYCARLLASGKLPDAGLPNLLPEEGFGGIDRDKSYLQYKTYSPTAVIDICGVQAWIRIKESLLLGDLHTPGKRLSAEDCRQVISGLKKIASRLGLSSVTFIISEDTPAFRHFAAYHTPIPSYPVLIQDFGAGLNPEKLRFSLADIDIF